MIVGDPNPHRKVSLDSVGDRPRQPRAIIELPVVIGVPRDRMGAIDIGGGGREVDGSSYLFRMLERRSKTPSEDR